MTITNIQNGIISWDHLGDNLSLKKVEMAIPDSTEKLTIAPMIFAEMALRTAKPIAHIPAMIPTTWCHFMTESPESDKFLNVLEISL